MFLRFGARLNENDKYEFGIQIFKNVNDANPVTLIKLNDIRFVSEDDENNWKLHQKEMNDNMEDQSILLVEYGEFDNENFSNVTFILQTVDSIFSTTVLISRETRMNLNAELNRVANILENVMAGGSKPRRRIRSPFPSRRTPRRTRRTRRAKFIARK